MPMIHFDKRKWIYLNIINPFKTMNKLKGVFKPLRCFFKISFKEWDYNPVLWCSKPAYIHIMSSDVMWKDKYNTPRYEVPPYIWIHVWKLNLVWYWDLPLHQWTKIDDYWEQALWYLFYYDEYKMKVPDILNAENYWPYTDLEHNSTWSQEFLIR